MITLYWLRYAFLLLLAGGVALLLYLTVARDA